MYFVSVVLPWGHAVHAARETVVRHVEAGASRPI
jgi:hypothetical protein